jgi:pimeloyl-ACP methyl ester carboxylesterase
MAAVEEKEMTLDGVRVFYRRVPGSGTPTVYCHGNPSHGEDWLPFMARGGPSIAIDMPGWGRSDRPDPDRFDYSMDGLSAFLERCLDELGIAERKLVVHDWGVLALIGAQRRPQLIEKLVIVNSIPLTHGYRWHWIAQIWRRRPAGEIVNRLTNRSSMALLMRQATGDRGPMPEEFVDMVWGRWDAERGGLPWPCTATQIPTAWRPPAGTWAASPVPRWSSGASGTRICRRSSPRRSPTRSPTRKWI